MTAIRNTVDERRADALTRAQAAALVALRDWDARHPGRSVEARDIGASAAALAALIRGGMVARPDTMGQAYGWDRVRRYLITNRGRNVAMVLDERA